MTPTTEELDRLERLYAEATPGKWREGQDGNMRVYGEDGRGEHSGLIADVFKGRPNVSFITEAHNALPTLLAAARALPEAIARAERAAFDWLEGVPPKPWSSEWFIALLDNGDRVVLRPLPEEYTYDFTTADDTYYAARRIRKWMQFPDSKFKSAALTAAEAEVARLREAVVAEREACALLCDSEGSIHHEDTRTLAKSMCRHLAKRIRSRTENPEPSGTNWALVDAKTDTHIAADVATDPDAVPLDIDWSKAERTDGIPLPHKTAAQLAEMDPVVSERLLVFVSDGPVPSSDWNGKPPLSCLATYMNGMWRYLNGIPVHPRKEFL